MSDKTSEPPVSEGLEELESKLSEDLKHTLKLVPSSQRELFVFELAKYLQSNLPKPQPVSGDLEELKEKLAAIEHERWADWQRWVHTYAVIERGEHPTYKPTGRLILEKHNVERWERQINTKYESLSDKEKASDMEQVDRYWPLIEAYIESTLTQFEEQAVAAVEANKINYTGDNYSGIHIAVSESMPEGFINFRNTEEITSHNNALDQAAEAIRKI